MNDLRYHCPYHQPCEENDGNPEYSGWWEHDARGIPLAKVCDKCRKAKLSVFRKDVLEDPNYWADEDIEPDYGPGEERW